MEQIRIDQTAAVAECILQKGDRFDEIALHMIQNNQIDHLITPVEYDEKASLLRYPIRGKISLYDLLREEEDWLKIRELLLMICRDTHQQLKEYLLFHNQIYYDPQYIYIDRGMVQYIYIPEKAANTYNLKKMLHNVLTDNKWNTGSSRSDFTKAVQFLDNIQWLTGREKQQFIELLADIKVQLPEPEAQLPFLTEEDSVQQPRPETEERSVQQPQPETEERFVQQPRPEAEERSVQQPQPEIEERSVQQPRPEAEGKSAEQSRSEEKERKAGQTEENLLKNHQAAEPVPESPYLIRLKTKEKIVITSEYFRIGKVAAEVEYVISGNSAISRQHAVIVKRGSNYYIMDTKSKNRTYVDGRVIFPNQPEIMIHETRVRMADEEFIFYLR